MYEVHNLIDDEQSPLRSAMFNPEIGKYVVPFAEDRMDDLLAESTEGTTAELFLGDMASSSVVNVQPSIAVDEADRGVAMPPGIIAYEEQPADPSLPAERALLRQFPQLTRALSFPTLAVPAVASSKIKAVTRPGVFS